MSGRLYVVGLGPGPAELMTPQASAALAEASDIVGYGPYVARLPERSGQRRHASDNRVELERARHALELARDGHTVAVVSSGDAGVFAMAAAVFEAIEAAEGAFAELSVEVLPGISAMHAAAARIGAPLGHDFCAISLSDNLKPWTLVTKRLRAAADADFVVALYNPASKARPWQLGAAFELLREIRGPETPVIFATRVGSPREAIDVVPLGQADPARADMSTVVIVGSSATRRVACGAREWVYTPRRALQNQGENQREDQR